jgi:hypothetical protein
MHEPEHSGDGQVASCPSSGYVPLGPSASQPYIRRVARVVGTLVLAVLGIALLWWAPRAGAIASASERRWRGYVSTDWGKSYRLFGCALLLFAALVALGFLNFGR